MIRRLGARLRPRDARDGEAGFTVIEVMVAMIVFALMSTGIAVAIVGSLQLSQSSRGRETAVGLASQDIDNLRQIAAASSGGIFKVIDGTSTKTVGNQTYTISRAADWVQADGTLTACGSSTTPLAYKSVVETVTWTGARGNTFSTTQTSAIAPSAAVSDPSDGTISISVKGATGAPNPGVTITITPTSGSTGAALSTQPAVTDSQGCSYATDVQPGNYTITAYEAGGIDTNQVVTSSQTPISVIAGSSAYVPFSYDQAATVSATYAPGYGATLPTSMVTTLSSTGGGLDQLTPWTTATKTSTTPVPLSLFPFTGGYQAAYAGVYNNTPGAGSCLDSNPVNWTTPNANKAVGLAVAGFGAPAGGTGTVNVMMGVIQVSGLTGQYVVATSTTPATGSGDPGCTATQTLRFPAATAAKMTYALPFGTWKITTATSLTGSVFSLLGSISVTNVTPGTVTGSSALGYTVMTDPRGQTS